MYHMIIIKRRLPPLTSYRMLKLYLMCCAHIKIDYKMITALLWIKYDNCLVCFLLCMWSVPCVKRLHFILNLHILLMQQLYVTNIFYLTIPTHSNTFFSHIFDCTLLTFGQTEHYLNAMITLSLSLLTECCDLKQINCQFPAHFLTWRVHAKSQKQTLL